MKNPPENSFSFESGMLDQLIPATTVAVVKTNVCSFAKFGDVW
jgi:hypothetical protein